MYPSRTLARSCHERDHRSPAAGGAPHGARGRGPWPRATPRASATRARPARGSRRAVRATGRRGRRGGSSRPTPRPPRTMFGNPGGEPGRHPGPLGRRLGVHEDEVVDVDDDDALDEARELRVAPVREAEHRAEQREHQAGRRDRELLLDLHRGVVGRDPLLLQRDDERPAARRCVISRSPLAGPAPRKHRLGIEAQHQLSELRHAVVLGGVGLARVLRAVLEHEFDGPLARSSTMCPLSAR